VTGVCVSGELLFIGNDGPGPYIVHEDNIGALKEKLRLIGKCRCELSDADSSMLTIRMLHRKLADTSTRRCGHAVTGRRSTQLALFSRQ